MSEIAKCPCCGSEASDFEQTGIVECEECMFMCDIKDLPRIAAAMELARATSARNKSLRGISTAWDEKDERRLRAKMRVLEVFRDE